MSNTKSILIVGAGLAGLSSALTLHQQGYTVTVLDKGRGVGGRMATRRFDGAVFDHGAQFFTVRDQAFETWVNQWLSDSVAVEWSKGFINLTNPTSGQYSRYCGTPSMTAIPKWMVGQLPPNTVHTQTKVTHIETDGTTWHIQAENPNSESQSQFTADALILTQPVGQTLDLLKSSDIDLQAVIKLALQAVTYMPCFSLLAVLDRPSRVPSPGAIQLDGQPIAWIADNQQKGVSPIPALTIHAGGQFSRQHFDDNPDWVAGTLINAARPYLDGAHVLSYQIHRWRYSQVETPHPATMLITDSPAPIAFAGDAFGGAKVEGAALSGMAAAKALDAQFQHK